MTKPNSSSAETLLRKSSWVGFVIGTGLMVWSLIPAKKAWEAETKIAYDLRRMTGGGGMSPEQRVILSAGEKEMRAFYAQDYWDSLGARAGGGLALILIGLGCSLYANKLRKARLGK